MFSGVRGNLIDELNRPNSFWREAEVKRVLAFGAVNFLCTVLLFFWCHSTGSLALTAYAYLSVFDLFRLSTCLLTLWVRRKGPSPSFSFGYERLEVLAVFSATMLAQLGAFFILKESAERLFYQPTVLTDKIALGAIVAFTVHVCGTYAIENPAFGHVVQASHSSWLQEHAADISESVCHVVPGLSKLLLPRLNPFALIASAGSASLIITTLLIDYYQYYAVDTWAAICVALMTCGTMLPMAVYTGKILLQTMPSHIIGQLDKSLREASTLDGVLEFRNEHFWTLSFGVLAGTLSVRIRRDANEQLVLAHVANRLSNLVKVLTIQVVKDTWLVPHTPNNILNHSAANSHTIGMPDLFQSRISNSPQQATYRAYPTTTISQANSSIYNMNHSAALSSER